MKSIRTSLSLQLLTGLLLFSIVPQSIIGIIAYGSGRNSIVTNVQTHLERVAHLKKQAIDKWGERLLHSLSWVAHEQQVIQSTNTVIHSTDFTKNFRAPRGDAYKFLVAEFNRLVELGEVSQLFLIDKNSGQIIVSSDSSWEGKFRSKESFFIKGRQELYISDIFLSLSMGRPTMVVSGPIKDNQGNLLAVLAAHADFDRLNAIMLERIDLGKTTETFLVNNYNLLITNTVFAPEGAFKKWIFGEGAERAIDGQSGVDLFMDYRNVPVLGAYLWLPDRKLALIAKQDVSEAFVEIFALKRKIFIVVVTVCLVIVFSGFLFARRITDPMQKLVEGVLAIGKGNLGYRVGITRQDEIGLLSRAFDKMAENLNATTISRDEKEVLLKEIHHRVKNNLQMIRSLLSLQMNQIKDKKLVNILEDSKNRISSIAMVHETLYKAEDLSIIDVKSYCQELTDYLYKSLHPTGSVIEIKCDVEQLPMDLDAVIACGLIINELVTNALKYAFIGKSTGRISIQLFRCNQTEAMLVVSDDGIGMPCSKSSSSEGSLGIHLVNILAEKQLEGNININQEIGLIYRIRFPLVT